MIQDRPAGAGSVKATHNEPEPDREESADGPAPGLVPQLLEMWRALWASPARTPLLVLAGALCTVIVSTAYGQIRLNSWNQPFYDALARRDGRQFLEQLGLFGVIGGSLLVLNVAQRWLIETTKLKLREGLVHDLVENWLVPGRAFRLANAGAIGVNPDQRMHEDARHLTELSADLGVGLLQASILLVTFVDVLWALSSDFVFQFGGRHMAVPGYMVWAAIVYSGSASILSYWVGHTLIDRNAQRYAREADLRYSLVRVNEHIDAIALSAGESEEVRRITVDLGAVLEATARLVTGLTRLTWVTAGYGWFTLVAPILAAAPLYFAGTLTFGGLMMAAGAFVQVQSSLRWFVDNFSTIADWRATLLRVASFRRALLAADTVHDTESRIDRVAGEPGRLVIDELRIASSIGCTRLEEGHVEVHAGERVLILGEPGAGKTLLFRTLAGLWPWGTGRIARADGDTALYVPRTPYLPPGTLREILAYPSAATRFAPRDYDHALTRLDLARLIPLLDTAQRWERELNDDEQQSLAFARVLLHAPKWVVIDEVLDGLDDAARDRVVAVLTQDLKEAGLVYIGREPPHSQFFSRILHLVKDCTARKLPRPVLGGALP